MLATPPPITTSSNALRIDVCDSEGVSDTLCAAWAALADDTAEPNCFMEAWFARPSFTHLRNDKCVRVLSVWTGDQLVGVLLLATAHHYGRMPVSHTNNWQSGQSFYGAPLIRAGFQNQFWEATLDTLDRAEWAPSFLSIIGIEEDGATHRGLVAAAAQRRRPSPSVHRQARALLASTLTPDAYVDQAIRAKKRKELRRLRSRLDELGEVTFSTLSAGDELGRWIEDFLVLESAGWKGSDGAAFANASESRAFFESMMRGAHTAGVLDMLRLDLNGEAIAMLINFIRPPGSFSFKIAYDESLARFSPGVLIELENLKRVLANPGLDWMDSCAVADHPMINSLWMERRNIIQVSVPLKGVRRRTIYSVCRALERGSAAVRELRR